MLPVTQRMPMVLEGVERGLRLQQNVHMAWHTPQVRDVSPPNSGSTASAIHLCIRNFVGGCGPLGAHPHCLIGN
jgi:hypothetical protein